MFVVALVGAPPSPSLSIILHRAPNPLHIHRAAGDTLPEVSAAVSRLAGCNLQHALHLGHQRVLQPQGWLATRVRCYHDAASGTLWVGVAAGAAPAATGTALSRDAIRVRSSAAAGSRACMSVLS